MNIEGHNLKNLNKVNVLLGKNGCGKSQLLRAIDNSLSNNAQYGNVQYISPERNGVLTFDSNVESQLLTNDRYISKARRRNQAQQFKSQTISQYKKLELLVLREYEKNQKEKFDVFINKINSLLDHIEIRRETSTFKIFSKTGEIKPNLISSGESELITLAIECLVFQKECTIGKTNILLLDEPDVHIHPDLQEKLMNFLKAIVEENDEIKIIIATHSTAILGALEGYEHLSVHFMKHGKTDIEFQPVADISKKILPVFGAHPLSNVFCKNPIMLVDGEDEERIWQKAVRKSKGKINIHPCSVGGTEHITAYENKVQEIIGSVYDNVKAYSLRDKDDANDNQIADLPLIKRFKLSCRNSENLILTDEVLNFLGTTWGELKSKIDGWLQKNSSHCHYSTMQKFKEGGYQRNEFNLKEIRNDLMSIMGSGKTWEIAVGTVIADLDWNDSTDFSIEGSIYSYLGEKLVKEILPSV